MGRFHSLALVAVLALGSIPAVAATGEKSSKPAPLIVAGKVSTFGPPGEGAGRTATGASSAAPGIALLRTDTLGRHFCVSLDRGRRAAVLVQTDYGPASFTGRRIDITGAAARKLGHVTTDERGHARLLPRRRGPSWRCGVR